MSPRVAARTLQVCLFSLLLTPYGLGSLFRAGTSIPVGQGPVALASGDFNGDGFADLAIVNQGGSSVNVLLGMGNGSFQPGVKYATAATSPSSLAVGDFNRDGKLDIAVNASTSLSILFGNGDGTFHPAVPVTIAYAGTFAIGDFNNDGILDLIYTGYNGFGFPDLDLELGNGDGTFQAPQTIFQQIDGLGFIVVGDFNRDGNADVAVVSDNDVGSTGAVKVVLGTGTGSFLAPATYSVGHYPESIAIGDFNGDGSPDLAIIDEENATNASHGALCILLNRGDGTFQLFRLYLAVADETSVSIATGDFDHDGIPDLAIANSEANDVNEFLGNGDGTFRKVATWSVGTDPLAVLAVDLNGDGMSDLITADIGANEIRVLLADSGGTFNGARNFDLPKPSYLGATGDFNEDGKTDIVAGGINLTILTGLGSGKFQATASYPTSDYLAAIDVVDLNGDNHLDLVAVNRNATGNGSVTVRLGNGDGTFQKSVNYTTAVESEGVAVADFNGDGILDIAVSNYGDTNGGNINLFFGVGDGTFHSGGALSIPNFRPEGIVAGDFNNDGNQDLATITLGGLAIVLGNGDGTFQPAMVTTGKTDYQFILAADFNRDGKLDLVISDGYPAFVSVLLGNGDGTFQSTDYTLGSNPYSMVIGDFNGDGVLDVAVADNGRASFGGELFILRGKGDGTFNVTSEGTVGSSPVAIVTGDFNQDGRPDVALMSELGGGQFGELTVLPNAGGH